MAFSGDQKQHCLPPARGLDDARVADVAFNIEIPSIIRGMRALGVSPELKHPFHGVALSSTMLRQMHFYAAWRFVEAPFLIQIVSSNCCATSLTLGFRVCQLSTSYVG